MLRSLVICLVLVLFMAVSAMAGTVIIVNKDNPIMNITSARLKNIYKGKIRLWDNGTKIIPVELDNKDPLAVKFTKTILGMNMKEKRRYWIEKVFSGSGAPPQQKKDEASVVSFVASEPGAIGYVNKENIDSSVKIITIDGQEEF